MRITGEVKKKLTNIRVFKYKGKMYVVSELKKDIKGFTGCYHKRQGVKYCLINTNLSPMEKQRALHELIKDKHLVGW